MQTSSAVEALHMTPTNRPDRQLWAAVEDLSEPLRYRRDGRICGVCVRPEPSNDYGPYDLLGGTLTRFHPLYEVANLGLVLVLRESKRQEPDQIRSVDDRSNRFVEVGSHDA
jgi:hypothetical protein